MAKSSRPHKPTGLRIRARPMDETLPFIAFRYRSGVVAIKHSGVDSGGGRSVEFVFSPVRYRYEPDYAKHESEERLSPSSAT